MIALEKVTAMWVNVNAYLIMSMHKIAHTMDVSTSNFNWNEMTTWLHIVNKKVRKVIFEMAVLSKNYLGCH